MNQKEAYEKFEIISKVYQKWEDKTNNKWARWRILPLSVTVVYRRTACDYCDVPMEKGDLRANVPTVHLSCYIKQLQVAMELYKEIKEKMVEYNYE